MRSRTKHIRIDNHSLEVGKKSWRYTVRRGSAHVGVEHRVNDGAWTLHVTERNTGIVQAIDITPNMLRELASIVSLLENRRFKTPEEWEEWNRLTQTAPRPVRTAPMSTQLNASNFWGEPVPTSTWQTLVGSTSPQPRRATTVNTIVDMDNIAQMTHIAMPIPVVQEQPEETVGERLYQQHLQEIEAFELRRREEQFTERVISPEDGERLTGDVI